MRASVAEPTAGREGTSHHEARQEEDRGIQKMAMETVVQLVSVRAALMGMPKSEIDDTFIRETLNLLGEPLRRPLLASLSQGLPSSTPDKLNEGMIGEAELDEPEAFHG